MQYYEKGWNDPISIKKCDIFDLESENERLQKEAASYTRPIKRNNKIINEVDPKYESRVIEIADKITANKMRVTKIQIFLDEIDKMFKTFPDSLGTWENLIDQKQYLEKKTRNPEHFVCFIDRSEEKMANHAAERKRQQAEILAQLAVVDECIKKIRPLPFESTSN